MFKLWMRRYGMWTSLECVDCKVISLYNVSQYYTQYGVKVENVEQIHYRCRACSKEYIGT